MIFTNDTVINAVHDIPNRVGHHSTSDDSSAYRPRDEVEYRKEYDNPIIRLRKYMYNIGIWDENTDKEWMTDARKEVSTFMPVPLTPYF